MPAGARLRGARVLSLGIFHRTEKKGVVSDGHWNRPWILCHQNKAGVFPHRDHPVWIRTLYHAECPPVQGRILCVWDWETDIGKGQDRQRQLLSFDAGSAGTGDSKAKGGKDSESCSCSRTSPYRVWKGKTEIQGISISKTANPFFIWRGTLWDPDWGCEIVPPGIFSSGSLSRVFKRWAFCASCGYRRLDGGLDAAW